MIRIVMRRKLFFTLAIIVLLAQVAAVCADAFFSSQSSSLDGASTRSGSMPFFPMRASTDNKKLAGPMFQDPKGCGACHTAIYKEWESSVMAYSWQDPIYREILKRASKATDGALDNFCIGCHSPIGLTTETVTARGPEVEIAEDGVGCESCHNISAATGLGNGSYVLTPQKEWTAAQIRAAQRCDIAVSRDGLLRPSYEVGILRDLPQCHAPIQRVAHRGNIRRVA